MFRVAIAGVLGAVTAVAAAFLVAAAVCAVGGAAEPYSGRRVYGWDGAQLGLLYVAFLGLVLVWPLIAVALIGAAAGVAVQVVRRRRAPAA